MKKLTKFIALALALVMITGTLSACGGGGETPATQATQAGGEDVTTAAGGQTSSGPQYGGHLDVRMASTLQGLDPLKQTGMWRYIFLTCVYEPAVTRDSENNLAPCVCDFELSDDELTFSMWVRDGYTFSNGDPVDIYDVEASFNRAFKMFSSITKKVVPHIESSGVEGDKFVIHFKENTPYNLYYLASYQTWCAVMPKEICEKYSQNYIVDQVEDAIGTGPYYFTEIQDNVKISMAKRDNYTPVENSGSGLAGTKYGYLDSITYWVNNSDPSAALALLSGEYDVCEVIPQEYEAMAVAQGLACNILKSNVSYYAVFNNVGQTITAKYPSLRKAIMAAIDYEGYLDVVTDSSQTMETNMILDEIYDTDIIKGTDYYGPANQEIVDKYLAEARAQGYDDEPVQFVCNGNNTSVPTLIGDYLEKAGINYQIQTMEQLAFSKYISESGNNYDFYCTWYNTPFYPTSLDDNLIVNHWKSEAKDQILAEMGNMKAGSEEYKAKWQELQQVIADECGFAFMSRIDWFWWAPATFHPNDDDSFQRTMVNAYWEDPENHMN